jgi:hypothetical protein
MNVVATEPVIRARLRKARDKQYHGGVLGLRAAPVWNGGGFEFDGTPVSVVACPSVLAIWEAIEARRDDQWTVVLTSIDDDDLSDTVLAHLLDGRLLNPDPWDALRANFFAATIEPALYRSANDRALANGLLAVLPDTAYTPAPSGVLTQAHAMSAIARDVLKIVSTADVEIDALAVLEWSLSPSATADFEKLRVAGGTDLSEAFISWLANRCGRLGRPLRELTGRGRIADLVPLGVIAGVFLESGSVNSRDGGAFLGTYGLNELTIEELCAWHADASGLLISSLKPSSQRTVLDTATAIVTQLGITKAAAASRLLPHGLDARLNALAGAVTEALAQHNPVISAAALQRIEGFWADVETHFLAHESSSAWRALTGGVRLARWLAHPVPSVTGLAGAVADYVSTTSWVDTALVTARRGTEKPIPAEALRTLIESASARRAGIDRMFAAALADAPDPPVPTVETVLADTVIPLAKEVPTLLIVVDALSLAASNELVLAAQRHGWIEASTAAPARRGAALAVLPTLTQRSRCSLLCGELREGAERVERAGFASLLQAAQLQPCGNIPDPIFHKSALDAVPSGLSLATEVSNAIADTSQKLVAVVLNYVDDTLHHTDPGGTDWNLTTITHLGPLLDAAKNAGRAVVITSDHGHLIEYRTSTKVIRSNVYGQRAHGDFANVDPDREVIVEGPRVLTEGNRVVLAVDEGIRYGSLNAGYHGGGSPAEAIVPVVILAPVAVMSVDRPPAHLAAVVGAEPAWWRGGVVPMETPLVAAPVMRKQRQEATLFDESPTPSANPLPHRIIRTKIFDEQYRLAGRIVLKREQIGSLLGALLAASAHEITLVQAAAALGVAAASANGALMQTKRVLDVEGYEVLRVDPKAVRLDVAALTEQFGVQP